MRCVYNGCFRLQVFNTGSTGMDVNEDSGYCKCVEMYSILLYCKSCSCKLSVRCSYMYAHICIRLSTSY